jgi:HPt (histidine-containing phosphotransfer) domain-containing protein
MGSTPLARKLAHNCLARGLGEAEDRLTGDPVDLAYLARFTLDNAALEREVLQLFAEQMPLYLEALRAAQVRKAWREAAHSIKGSAWAVGAWRLARCAELAERVEVDGEAAAPEEEREEAVVVVARAAEEACRFIGRRLAGN